MKILHVIASLAPRYGGPSKACLEMARATAARGHEVTIFTTDLDGPGRLDVPTDRPVSQDGVTIRYFPVQAPRFWRFSLPMARALATQVQDYNVVHIHSLYLFHGAAAGHYCRRYGVPYLIRPHGTLDPYMYRRHRLRKGVLEWLFERRNLAGAAGLHFTTEEESRLAAPYSCGAPGVVIPHGLDLADYERLPAPGTLAALYPETAGKPIVLFLGRINFKKGLDILAKAFGELARQREDVHMVIAGPDDDGYAEQVRAWLAAEGVLGRTTFTGMLTGEAKLAALQAAAMFVLPSYSENFGLAVAEAMAVGVPVVISDKVNIWREIAAAEAGRIAPCHAGRFAAIMADLLADPAAARQLGDRGRALVRERYQWASAARALEEVYLTVAASGRPDGSKR